MLHVKNKWTERTQPRVEGLIAALQAADSTERRKIQLWTRSGTRLFIERIHLQDGFVIFDVDRNVDQGLL